MSMMTKMPFSQCVPLYRVEWKLSVTSEMTLQTLAKPFLKRVYKDPSLIWSFPSMVLTAEYLILLKQVKFAQFFCICGISHVLEKPFISQVLRVFFTKISDILISCGFSLLRFALMQVSSAFCMLPGVSAKCYTRTFISPQCLVALSPLTFS